MGFKNALLGWFTALLLAGQTWAVELSFDFHPQTIRTVKAAMAQKATWQKLPKKVNLCMFVPGGSSSLNQGTDFALQMMRETPQFAKAARNFGLEIDAKFVNPQLLVTTLRSPSLKISHQTQVHIHMLTDEGVVVADFQNKRCDGIAISTLRAKTFNPFLGSLDAIGAIENYKQLQLAAKVLSAPAMAARMSDKTYEVTGIIPIGAAYPFLTDKRINTVHKVAGKKIAVLSFDPSQTKMVEGIGAQAVPVNMTNLGSAFNNKQVDVMVLPAILFQPLELYKGMHDATGAVTGGVVKFPLMQLTATMLIRKNVFPDGVGQLLREFTAQNMQPVFGFISQAEQQIPKNLWIHMPEADHAGYKKLMRETRINMTKQGYYNPQMMQILKKVRCQDNPSSYECRMNDE